MLYIRKWYVLLIWMLVFAMMFSVLGCQGPTPEEDPDPGEVTAPDDDPVVPDDPVDPEPDDPVVPEDPVTPEPPPPTPEEPMPVLTDPVTAVPEDYAGQDLMAVIRLGDLWLLAEDGQVWRQTDTGNVQDVVWAPDGHALAFTLEGEEESKDLYYLVRGSTPALVDEDIKIARWSPDSTRMAYATADGDLRITSFDISVESETFTLTNKIRQGPHWLSEDVFAYVTSKDYIPSTILINTQGEEIQEWPHTVISVVYPGGALLATGPFSEGPSQTDYSGLARISVDGEDLTQIYDQSVRFNHLELSPDQESGMLGIGNGESLVLLPYTQEDPDPIELITQEVYITYSDFRYPLWFTWAPDGSRLAALHITLSQGDDDFGWQEGSWDLLLLDTQGNQSTLVEEIYTISSNESNNPGVVSNDLNSFPLRWSSCGDYIYYVLCPSNNLNNLWRVNVADGTTELVLENCSLPIFRP